MQTEESFLSFYPQFSVFAGGVVLTEYLSQANARFQDFGSDAEEARRLYTAHRLTLYAASLPPENCPPSAALLADSGRGALQAVSSRRVGEVSVTYSGAFFASSASAGFRDLDLTAYGLQLRSLLRLYGYARYFP